MMDSDAMLDSVSAMSTSSVISSTVSKHQVGLYRDSETRDVCAVEDRWKRLSDFVPCFVASWSDVTISRGVTFPSRFSFFFLSCCISSTSSVKCDQYRCKPSFSPSGGPPYFTSMALSRCRLYGAVCVELAAGLRAFSSGVEVRVYIGSPPAERQIAH